MSTQDNNEKNMANFEFEVSAADFENAINKAYKKNVGKINIQGFRKGKAPRAIIERFYGKEVFYEDAINIVLPDAYSKALDEKNIDAVAQPEIDVKEVSAEKGVIFTAKVAVKPEFDLGTYKGVSVKKVMHKTVEKEINGEIESIRKRNARLVTIDDRAAEMDDSVNIDFDGYVDDKAFEGGKSEKFDLKLGSGQFIPGFEEQVVGMKIDEEKDINVKFPEDYHAEDLKGKDAVFKVKLNSIKKEELPELDDEFAKDVSEFDTFEEFKADVTKKLKEKNKLKSKQETEDKVIEEVCNGTEIDIPEAMINVSIENRIREISSQMQYQGIDFNQYMQYTGTTLDQMKEQIKPDAEKQVKQSLILEKIAKIENIEVSEEEIEKEFELMAEQNKMKVEDIKKYIKLEDIKDKMITDKTIAFIVENANIK